jgi:hypothetical protein
MACRQCGTPAMMGKCAKCKIGDAPIRHKRTFKGMAKALRSVVNRKPPKSVIEVQDETKIETKPEVPAEPEKVEPADVFQGNEYAKPDSRSRSERHRISIWEIDSEEFRERTISMPHLRRGKIR